MKPKKNKSLKRKIWIELGVAFVAAQFSGQLTKQALTEQSQAAAIEATIFDYAVIILVLLALIDIVRVIVRRQRRKKSIA